MGSARRWITAGLLALPVAAGLAASSSPIEATWLKLADSSNQCEELYDYFPNSGMRAFWCHASGLFTTEELALSAAMPIWVSGPHTPTRLDLNAPADFGHYNPEFVSWMADHLIPGASDPAFRASTQATYDRAIAPLARIAWLTRLKLQQDPACAQAELERYTAVIARGAAGGPDARAHIQRWFYFLNPGFCGAEDPATLFYQGLDLGVDGDIVKTTVGFWLRRRMDGTEGPFADGLRRLLETYDAAWLASARLPSLEAERSRGARSAAGEKHERKHRKKGGR